MYIYHMKFNLNFPIKKELLIDLESQFVLVGSCFSQQIGKKLVEMVRPTSVNPFGVIYNPVSIGYSIERICEKQHYSEKELLKKNDIHYSFDHHGSLSNTNAEDAITQINAKIDRANELLQKKSILLITLGTAKVFEMDQKIVANCHKLPSKMFTTRMLEVHEIVEALSKAIRSSLKLNEHINVLFTISPVRHYKDGFITNQRSKSRLHLAVEQLVKQFECATYFPAYEIMMDELRDHRFYADDLLHPSTQAVDYIWERFRETYAKDEFQTYHQDWQNISSKLNHRPLFPDSEASAIFKEKLKLEVTAFCKRYSLDESDL